MENKKVYVAAWDMRASQIRSVLDKDSVFEYRCVAGVYTNMERAILACIDSLKSERKNIPDEKLKEAEDGLRNSRTHHFEFRNGKDTYNVVVWCVDLDENEDVSETPVTHGAARMLTTL